MGQFWVFSNSLWFSFVSARSKTSFFQAGDNFSEAEMQETLAFLIDLSRMNYFLLNAWEFPAFRKWYFNAFLFFLMLTGYNSVFRWMINLKLTLLPSIISNFKLKEAFCQKKWIHKVTKANIWHFQSPTVGRKAHLKNGNQHWISRLPCDRDIQTQN